MRCLRQFARLALFVLLSAGLTLRPVAAQSVLRDAETEKFLQDISAPLVAAAGLQPGNVKIILIGDPEINAFVAGGQYVYIHSGLLIAATSANEVQGVIAHEIGHITGGHVIRNNEGAKPAMGIMLLSLLLGAAAAAAGSAEAGMGLFSAGQRAAMGKYLAFSRAQEGSADAAGASFLEKAGITGKGMLSFFGKLRSQEYRLTSSYAQVDPYAQTHPLTADRITTLRGTLEASPNWNKPTDAGFEKRFARIKGKLYGFVTDPDLVLRKYPESDQSVLARYARAYAWHRAAYPEKAEAEIEKLVASDPQDPYFLELKGQILTESGKPTAAIAPLRAAVANSRNEPLIAASLGHALIASEDPKNLAEAGQVLKLAVNRDEDNPFAWYELGLVYDRAGDRARAAMASAERYSLINQPGMALSNAEMALQGLPAGTPDYIRAQDIAVTARNEMENQKSKRR
ncbi:M48 family metalloprotease [Sphingomonas naphthae]|uniref:M48 family metalloprotease n=1 Tax=Sphingomonas naphthae TaxID=1813468 RepID=A0ABY7THM0_9SPHN|nr:M48 family metalloprotease [Sphingomonas naphthae]WCT72727.1 M48 family metalloprotease [Sphingomonas naphthae]